MTSPVGTSVSTVMVMHRLPFCFAATIAVAVDRPSLTTSMLQLDRTGPDHDRAREHRGHRAHRLLREPFGHSDNRLGEHLRALDHLPLVLARGARLGGEAVLSVGLHVEQVEQALNGPGVCAESVVMGREQ